MYARPLWDWTLQLVQDPRLSDVIVWDAEKAYFYNGEKYVRFFTEPWTANAVWAVQVCHLYSFQKSQLTARTEQPSGVERCQGLFLYFICRQGQTFIFWYPERVSYHREARQHLYRLTQQHRMGWRTDCRMASRSEPVSFPLSLLSLIPK
jgi:hypothetical protein